MDEKKIEACWNCRYSKGIFLMKCTNPQFVTTKVDLIYGIVHTEYHRCKYVRNNNGSCSTGGSEKHAWEPRDATKWTKWRLLKNEISND